MSKSEIINILKNEVVKYGTADLQHSIDLVLVDASNADLIYHLAKISLLEEFKK